MKFKRILKKTLVLMMISCMASFLSPALMSWNSTEYVVYADTATDNAYRSAKNYIQFMPFSKRGLIDQLSSDYGDKYTKKQAKAAVKRLEKNKEVNWKEQAVKVGQNYLDMMGMSRQDMMGMSRQGLIDQLSSDYGDKFTVKQATYAADKLGL